QTALVASGLTIYGRGIGAWLRGRRILFLALGAGGCGALAAALSRDPRYYALEVAFAAFLQCVNAANILLLAWSIPVHGFKPLARWFDSLLGSREDHSPVRMDRFAW